MKKLSKKGQSALEYSVLLMIVIGALIATQIYFKRGIQGRWKSASDELGDQYDPRTATGAITYSTFGNTSTNLSEAPAPGGFHTTRVDFSNMVETKTGNMTVGPYSN